MRVPIGSIIQIPTSKGFAYAQYTHKVPKQGQVVRVLEGFHKNPQTDLDKLAQKASAFSILYTLIPAVKLKQVELIGNRPVPEFARKFPVFKNGFPDPVTHKVGVWVLWDGENYWKTPALSEKEKNYPPSSIWNTALLIHRLESGWTPRTGWVQD